MEPIALEEMAKLEGNHWWFRGRRHILRSVLCLISPGVMARILEIGAGTGGNIAWLQDFGTVEAVEPNPLARSFCTRPSVPPVLLHDSRLPALVGVPRNAFDLVCAFDVLEHVSEDRDSLAEIHGLLNVGGSLMITVPALPWLFGPHDRMLHHLRRYTKQQLREIVEAAGFEIIKISYFNMFLLPLAVLARIWDMACSREGSSGSDMPSPLINELLYRTFRAEVGLLEKFNLPFGLSLLCVARPIAAKDKEEAGG